MTQSSDHSDSTPPPPPAPEKPPGPPKNSPPPAPNPSPAKAHTPVRRAGPPPRKPSVAPDNRRDFFSDAVREALGPFSGLIERKLNPLLAALESLPTEAEKFTDFQLPPALAALDQPQSRRASSLPQLPEAQPVEPPRFLRPPGAMAPGEFETVCSRCGECAKACPANAIRLDHGGGKTELFADGLPYILPADQPCVVCDSLACMKSCPTGALKLVDRLKLTLGTAKVDRFQCVRENGEDCTECVTVCPITQANTPPDATAPAADAIFIHAPTGRVRVRKNICVGCGLCERACPTSPKAITITPYRPPVDPIIA